MELLSKLERKILQWLKSVPHLPTAATKWLGDNIWWIAIVALVLSAIGAIIGLVAVITAASLVGTVAASYYAVSTYTAWAVITGLVSLAFMVIEIILLGMAIKPLQAKQKKGWVLLFAVWLVSAVSVVVNAVLSLNPLSFIFGIIFGAIWLAISGYILFELHGQFAHTEKSKGVKAAKK